QAMQEHPANSTSQPVDNCGPTEKNTTSSRTQLEWEQQPRCIRRYVYHAMNVVLSNASIWRSVRHQSMSSVTRYRRCHCVRTRTWSAITHRSLWERSYG
ncbi:hypothetical protein GCK32_017948, partial [Trichostrongylus colubriformis]